MGTTQANRAFQPLVNWERIRRIKFGVNNLFAELPRILQGISRGMHHEFYKGYRARIGRDGMVRELSIQ